MPKRVQLQISLTDESYKEKVEATNKKLKTDSSKEFRKHYDKLFKKVK